MDFDEVCVLEDSPRYDRCAGWDNPYGNTCGNPCGNSCDPCSPSGSGGVIEEGPHISENCWQLFLDVSCFNPDDITVCAENNKIIVKIDNGTDDDFVMDAFCIDKEYKREWDLPKEFDPDDVAVYISCDCILVISVKKSKYRCYPIQPIGPARCYIQCVVNNMSCSGGKCEWKPKGAAKKKPDDKKPEDKKPEDKKPDDKMPDDKKPDVKEEKK